jgi:hypothetical protein
MGTPDVRNIHNLESMGNPLKKMGPYKRENKRKEEMKNRKKRK